MHNEANTVTQNRNVVSHPPLSEAGRPEFRKQDLPVTWFGVMNQAGERSEGVPPAAVKDGTCDRCCLARELLAYNRASAQARSSCRHNAIVDSPLRCAVAAFLVLFDYLALVFLPDAGIFADPPFLALPESSSKISSTG